MPKVLKIIFLGILNILIFGFFSYLIISQNIFNLKEPFMFSEPEFQEKISPEQRILNQLTLEQKVGQLFLIGFEGRILTPEGKETSSLLPPRSAREVEEDKSSSPPFVKTRELENLIKTIHPGGVLLLSRNIESEEQLKKLIDDLQKTSLEDAKLPLFVAIDQEGEPMSRIKFLSEKTPQSKIKNIAQAFEVGFSRGRELKNLGINLNLAPVLDITEPSDFLYSRSFQKNPKETGELAKSLISGQKEAKILTAVKHFPGYGDISFNPEREKLPVLLNIPEISQFKTALGAQPEMLMVVNVIYKKIDQSFPFSLSSQGIQFLKEELGNNFLVISDDLSSPVLKKEFSLKNTVILAFKSGIDILIVAGFDEPEDPLLAFNSLLGAVKKGEISEEELDHQVLKIIELKQKLLK